MKFLDIFSKLLTKEVAPEPAKPAPESAKPAAEATKPAPAATPAPAPAATVPWTPRHAPRNSGKAAQRGRHGAQPQHVSAAPTPPAHAAPPAPGKAAPPAANARPATVAKADAPVAERPTSVPVSDAPSRPLVPPVGGRGETDLAPSRADLEGVSFPSVESSGDDVDRAAIRELFSDIAAGQAAPVKSFITDLRAGTATGEWLQVCKPVMSVLFESATSLGLSDAASPMSEFISAMDLASDGRDGKEGPIDGTARDLILEAYASLTKAFPEVFAIGQAGNRRDTMLLHALLKQVQGVGTVTLDAMYAAGLTSVAPLVEASSTELSTTTGVSVELCEAICSRVREHRAEIDRTAHLPSELRFSTRLVEQLRAMAREHDVLERLTEEAGFDDERAERKRTARRNRDFLALKLEATLIEMGEFDRSDALRAMSFERRIEHMEQFLGVRVAKRAAEQR